jgi:hypothetical protein
VPKKGWPATERPPAWLAASYRCWLTIQPSRKPVTSANDRSRCAEGVGAREQELDQDSIAARVGFPKMHVSRLQRR